MSAEFLLSTIPTAVAIVVVLWLRDRRQRRIFEQRLIDRREVGLD